MNKRIIVYGGGTVSHISNHLALAAPAYGSTALWLGKHLYAHPENKLDVSVIFSRMAGEASAEWTDFALSVDGFFGRGDRLKGIVRKDIETFTSSPFETTDELALSVREDVANPNTKIIFFSPAVVDFETSLPKGKHGARFKSADYDENHPLLIPLTPVPKIIANIRKNRKDIFLVGFKTTTGADDHEMYLAALNMLKKTSCNLVLANDVVRRANMIVTPEEASYSITYDREAALKELVEMALLRSHLTFTRSSVVAGEPIPWTDAPSSLQEVVNYCIKKGAYQAFNGATVGHFAYKIDDCTFVTSKRKTNFKDIEFTGMVLIKTDGPDTVLAYGAKPSVGGQSQRIIFHDHPGYDCILHFHCVRKPSSLVPVRSQREFECGSHECGKNASDGLRVFHLDGDTIKAVFLDHHGPNILFNKSINPTKVINFIEENFDLSLKTGGFNIQ